LSELPITSLSEVRDGIDEISFVPNNVFDILSEILSLIILKINILILDFNLITCIFLLAITINV
jgi:hypothetical protein